MSSSFFELFSCHFPVFLSENSRIIHPLPLLVKGQSENYKVAHIEILHEHSNVFNMPLNMQYLLLSMFAIPFRIDGSGDLFKKFCSVLPGIGFDMKIGKQ